jgi:hypothetical protein
MSQNWMDQPCSCPLRLTESPGLEEYAVHQFAAYSITSSARVSRIGGISRPIALAVLRLMTSSNVVGCSIGSSAGLAPLKIWST